MKLYTTPTSPYGRIVRIVVAEKGLGDRIEVIAPRTRVPGSDYYAINPSGRVPFLVRGDGRGMEDSRDISLYLDRLCPPASLHPDPCADGHAYGQLEARARSLLDGLAVLVREQRRPATEQSPSIIAHEQDRAARLADHWEEAIAHPLMQGAVNMAQITLAVALQMPIFYPVQDLTQGRAGLSAWLERMAQHPSIAVTVPARP